MTAEQFCYWLQGFSELGAGELPTAVQWKSINDHLATVFVKVTPSIPYQGIRTMELRPEDKLREIMNEQNKWNQFVAPVITC